MGLPFLVLLLASLTFAQNWATQRHFTNGACSGTPYLEAAANMGTTQCSALPCQLILTTSDFATTQCGLATTIQHGLTIQTFSTSNCQNLVSENVYVIGTCVSFSPTSSVKYVCDNVNGPRQLNYGDGACTALTSNVTMVAGPQGMCLSNQMYTCAGNMLQSAVAVFVALFLISFV